LEKQVSKARKEGVCKPQMVCQNPVNIAGVNKNGQRVAQGNQTYGKELTEEELLKEHNQNKQLTNINYKFLEYENCRSQVCRQKTYTTRTRQHFGALLGEKPHVMGQVYVCIHV
jgi:hypothetical protein